MAPKLRLEVGVGMAAIAVALWIGTAQVDPDPPQLWVGAIFASVVGVVFLVWSIVGFVKDKKDGSEPPSKPAFIDISDSEGTTIEDNTDATGLNRPVFLGQRNKRMAIRRNRSIRPPTTDEGRRSWLFPEMPWKRKKDSGE